MKYILSEICFKMLQKILSKFLRIMVFNTQPTINEVRGQNTENFEHVKTPKFTIHFPI